MFDHTSGIVFAPFVGYLSIISEAFDRVIEYLSGESAEDPNLSGFANTADGQASIVVVFTAIVLESFIQNYAARRLGKHFVEQHIENMSLVTKWLVVPRLVVGKTISPDHPGVELLRKLVAARNRLVHLKSRNIKWDLVKDTLPSLRQSKRALIAAALSAFKCMGLLGEALCDMDPEERIGRLFAQMTKVPKYVLAEGSAKRKKA